MGRLEELRSSMWAHECVGKRIVSEDDPLSRVMGWCCVGCGSRWRLRLVEVKELEDSPLKEMLMAPEGRVRMARLFMKELCVTDEREDCP